MKYDKPLVAVLLGVVSTLPVEVFTIISKKLGYATYTLYQLDSLVFTGNRPVPLMGFIASILVGGFIGFMFYYGLEKVGTDYLITKSVCFGLFCTAFLEVVVTFSLERHSIPPRPIPGYYTQLIGGIVFGYTMGILFKKYLVEGASKF